MIGAVCHGCKRLADMVYTDELGLGYCAQCVPSLPVPVEVQALQYLLASVPFEAGDRVECRTGGVIYDGVGTVREVSFDLEHGGTLIYPAFLVEIDEPADELSPKKGWYTEVCLTKKKAAA